MEKRYQTPKPPTYIDLVPKKKSGAYDSNAKIKPPKLKVVMSGKRAPPTKRSSKDLFYLAAKDPFNPLAEGVRMPDPFCFPTSTYKMQSSSVISPSGTKGTIVLIPNPFVSVVDLSAVNSGSVNIASGSGWTQVNSTTPNKYIMGLTTPANMATGLSSYRTVAVGWKLRLATNYTNRQGRVFFAPIPYTRGNPGYNLISSGTAAPMSGGSDAMKHLCGGIGLGIADSTDIQNLPGAFDMSFDELSAAELQLECKIFSSKVQDFKVTAATNVYSSGVAYGDIGATDGGILSNDTLDFEDSTDCIGMSGWIIHFEGVVATSCFEIESIFHFEGLPVVNSGRPTVSGIRDSGVHTRFEQVLQQLEKVPWARVIKVGMNVSNSVALAL
jgi:hypothetical protein